MIIKKFTKLGQRHPTIWITAWLAWFITLWLLSSSNPAPKNLPAIPHLDKIAHFGFFFGGGGLLCAWIAHHFKKFRGYHCVLITTVAGSIVGVIDEYHQTFTPGRSGNDFGDWVADTLGTFTGAITMILILKATSAWQRKHPKTTPPAQQ